MHSYLMLASGLGKSKSNCVLLIVIENFKVGCCMFTNSTLCRMMLDIDSLLAKSAFFTTEAIINFKLIIAGDGAGVVSSDKQIAFFYRSLLKHLG